MTTKAKIDPDAYVTFSATFVTRDQEGTKREVSSTVRINPEMFGSVSDLEKLIIFSLRRQVEEFLDSQEGQD